MAKPDILRKGVEVPIGPQEGPEFQGVPGASSEHLEGGKVGRVGVEPTVAATNDLSNLAKAVQKADIESRGNVPAIAQEVGVSEEQVTNILSGNADFGPQNAHKTLEALLNAGSTEDGNK